MGALSALIIGPCVTAPLIGALLYIASSKDYVLGGFALFALGFGMGTPLLALGTSATSLIKKVGPYLDLVNKFFGLLFFIVGIFTQIHTAFLIGVGLSILAVLIFCLGLLADLLKQILSDPVMQEPTKEDIARWEFKSKKIPPSPR